jgi:hypothetical protein
MFATSNADVGSCSFSEIQKTHAPVYGYNIQLIKKYATPNDVIVIRKNEEDVVTKSTDVIGLITGTVKTYHTPIVERDRCYKVTYFKFEDGYYSKYIFNSLDGKGSIEVKTDEVSTENKLGLYSIYVDKKLYEEMQNKYDEETKRNKLTKEENDRILDNYYRNHGGYSRKSRKQKPRKSRKQKNTKRVTRRKRGSRRSSK